MAENVYISAGTKEESDYVRRKLIEYNAQHVPDDLKSVYEEINLTVKDAEGRVVGGLLSVHCWNWIEVDILWVDPSLRGSGYGTRLLTQIEQIAQARNCDFIKLNTFSFQAPEFYRKNGFEEVAVFDNAPTGSQHYYFKKELVRSS